MTLLEAFLKTYIKFHEINFPLGERPKSSKREFHETCHSITFYLMKNTSNDAVTP